MKQQYPLTSQKELAIKKIGNAYLIKMSAVENDPSSGPEKIVSLKLEFEQQLQIMLSKEEYDAYCNQRNKLVVNLAHQRKMQPENFKSISDKETGIMKARYNLTEEQLLAVGTINDTYFKKMTERSVEKDLEILKQKSTQLQQEREQQLQTLFNKQQYAAYRKDMDAIGIEIQKKKAAMQQVIEMQKQQRKATKLQEHKPTPEVNKESRL